jgi:hypothetical protein
VQNDRELARDGDCGSLFERVGHHWAENEWCPPQPPALQGVRGSANGCPRVALHNPIHLVPWHCPNQISTLEVSE